MLFRKILGNDWTDMFSMNYGKVTTSGEFISPENAFANIGTIFECIVIRANSFSKLPLQLFKYDDTRKVRDRDNPLWYLLEKRPNKYQTPSQFKSYIEVSRLLWGNAFVEMKFDARGNIIALEPLEPQYVTIEKNLNNDYIYIYQNSTKRKVFTEDEILHFPYTSSQGKVGKAPMEVARESVGNLMAINKFEGNFYKNGTMTTGVLEAAGELGRPARRKIKEEWKRLYSGVGNAGDIAVIDSGLQYKPITLPLKDMEFIASRKMNKSEIATIFDVPSYMLNDIDNAKYTNVEQQNLRYLVDVLQPEVTAAEEELNYKLFTEEQAKKNFVKFNLNSAMRADSKTRAEYYKEMLGMGLMSINEARDKEDLHNIGEIGDKHYMSLNYTTLETLEKHNRIKDTGGGGSDE